MFSMNVHYKVKNIEQFLSIYQQSGKLWGHWSQNLLVENGACSNQKWPLLFYWNLLQTLELWLPVLYFLKQNGFCIAKWNLVWKKVWKKVWEIKISLKKDRKINFSIIFLWSLCFDSSDNYISSFRRLLLKQNLEQNVNNFV